MARWLWLMLLVLTGLYVAASGGREVHVKHEDSAPLYNRTLAKILVEYASAVYITDLTALFTWTCSRCNDLTKDFEMIELIVDIQNCLQAFVGVAHDLNSVIISFRGTTENSIKNWVQDLFWKLLDLNYPGVKDAKVHRGFYSAYHNTTLRRGIISSVKVIKELYGSIPVIVTGHSLGGALASFCALDLTVNFGFQDIQLMTFGQPRIGNTIFASYFNKHVPDTIRVTHGNDIVPHLPPYYSYLRKRTYHHFPREVWLCDIIVDGQEDVEEKICDGSGEDPSCSRSVYGTSIKDHLDYYGMDLEADTWGSCRVVMDSRVSQYHVDYNGDIILSRDLIAPNLQMY
ncbi:putative feruloyl esterase A isoform X2 [Canna indica]|uniref:Feruloyl esterase A isoform X2 n=1 Tax=Canna indica TaxID=4628 RepID=A0AAQ3Q3D2_9LILI|nr:putative feruloyl esterase A isoform X2 [Canna indica]